MLSYIRKVFTRKKTLRKHIQAYLYKKDVCCETKESVDTSIQYIFDFYDREGKTDVDQMNKDFLDFIADEKEAKRNSKARTLRNEVRKETTQGKALTEENIKAALHEVPFYFLMAFLGNAYYKYGRGYTHELVNQPEVEQTKLDVEPVEPVEPTEPVQPVEDPYPPKNEPVRTDSVPSNVYEVKI